jgi:hypothetical protein
MKLVGIDSLSDKLFGMSRSSKSEFEAKSYGHFSFYAGIREPKPEFC